MVCRKRYRGGAMRVQLGGGRRSRQNRRLRPWVLSRPVLRVADDFRCNGPLHDAINRLGLAADEAKKLLDSMPVAYAVTYMFGTVGSAIVIALVCPALLRLDLVKACKDYEQKYGGAKELGGAGTAWHRWEMRAFRVQPGARVSASEPPRPKRCSRKHASSSNAFGVTDYRGGDRGHGIAAGDVVAVAGAREALVSIMANAQKWSRLRFTRGGRKHCCRSSR